MAAAYPGIRARYQSSALTGAIVSFRRYQTFIGGVANDRLWSTAVTTAVREEGQLSAVSYPEHASRQTA